MQRRQFLQSCGHLLLSPYTVGGLLPFLTPAVFSAESAEDNHFLLVVRVWGAMDSTVGLNPWVEGSRPDDKDLFLDENYKPLINAGGTQLNLGLAAAGLAPYVRNLSSVHGIYMGTEDLGHPFAQTYITTSKSSPDAPHLIAELAENLRVKAKLEREPILFQGNVNTFDLTQLSKIPLAILSDQPGQQSSNSDNFKSPVLNFGGDHPIVRAYRDSLKIDRDRKVFYRIFAELQKRYLKPQKAGDANTDTEGLQDMALAAAFAGGVTRFAQMDWDYMDRLDNHTDFAVRHANGQKHVWDRLSKLLKMMSELLHPKTKRALFPHHVTVAVLTEFSRTPFRNGNDGKDHNIYDSSILLGGRGIQGGLSIGNHHLFRRDERRLEAQLSGCHIDFKTGAVVRSEEFNTANLNQIRETEVVGLIRPENILRTLTDVFKVDPRLMRLIGLDTRPLPGLVV